MFNQIKKISMLSLCGLFIFACNSNEENEGLNQQNGKGEIGGDCSNAKQCSDPNMYCDFGPNGAPDPASEVLIMGTCKNKQLEPSLKGFEYSCRSKDNVTSYEIRLVGDTREIVVTKGGDETTIDGLKLTTNYLETYPPQTQLVLTRADAEDGDLKVTINEKDMKDYFIINMTYKENNKIIEDDISCRKYEPNYCEKYSSGKCIYVDHASMIDVRKNACKALNLEARYGFESFGCTLKDNGTSPVCCLPLSDLRK